MGSCSLYLCIAEGNKLDHNIQIFSCRLKLTYCGSNDAVTPSDAVLRRYCGRNDSATASPMVCCCEGCLPANHRTPNTFLVLAKVVDVSKTGIGVIGSLTFPHLLSREFPLSEIQALLSCCSCADLPMDADARCRHPST